MRVFVVASLSPSLFFGTCFRRLPFQLIFLALTNFSDEINLGMYQIGKNSEWENYNTTVRKYLKGDVSAAAVEEAAQGCPCERSPLNVHPSTVKGGLLSVALARPLREDTVPGHRQGER